MNKSPVNKSLLYMKLYTEVAKIDYFCPHEVYMLAGENVYDYNVIDFSITE